MGFSMISWIFHGYLMDKSMGFHGNIMGFHGTDHDVMGGHGLTFQ
jgi:hypothetical protein